MDFLKWFDEPLSLDSILQAGLAQLSFVTIHPFETGTDTLLVQMLVSSFLQYVSSDRCGTNDYYDIWARTPKGRMEISP